MSNGRSSIQFSVEFVTTQNNLRKIVSELQQELAKVKPGTQIYESIAAQLEQAKRLMKNVDLSMDKGVTKNSDIDNLVNTMERLASKVRDIQAEFGNLRFSDLNLAHSGVAEPLKQWQAAQTELTGLMAKLNELKDKTLGDVLGGDKKGFGNIKMDQNALEFYDALLQKLEQNRAKMQELQEQQQRLTSLQSSQSDLATKKASVDTYSNAFAAMGVTKGTPGADKIAQTLMNGSPDEQTAVQAMLNQLGLTDKQIKDIINQADGKVKALAAQLRGLNIHQKIQEAIRNMTGGKSGAGALTGLDADLDAQMKKIGQIPQELAQIQSQMATLKRSTTNLEARKATLDGKGLFSTADFQNAINNLNIRITTLETTMAQKQGQLSGVASGGVNVPQGDPMAQQANAVKEQQRQLGAAMDSYARRWIGAYAIINKISQTIRKAWSDIQNLDKAMTSIAVVTDMSVSDLWGKLNEYMTIAQQYGVTTQGVYEVSQIYYQQGLATNEVMAATTETLKLARIAGMDYSAAADAMTVAIRSFKMEMTDAAIVTDVYSKVASATASDSEELAIAMSKTASSAESVGSSFENTTAMLAVMINVTIQ